MTTRTHTVTLCVPGQAPLVVEWPTLKEAADFRNERLGWLAQQGWRRDHASGGRHIRMTRGGERATMTIISRDSGVGS